MGEGPKVYPKLSDARSNLSQSSQRIVFETHEPRGSTMTALVRRACVLQSFTVESPFLDSECCGCPLHAKSLSHTSQQIPKGPRTIWAQNPPVIWVLGPLADALDLRQIFSPHGSLGKSLGNKQVEQWNCNCKHARHES